MGGKHTKKPSNRPKPTHIPQKVGKQLTKDRKIKHEMKNGTVKPHIEVVGEQSSLVRPTASTYRLYIHAAAPQFRDEAIRQVKSLLSASSPNKKMPTIHTKGAQGILCDATLRDLYVLSHGLRCADDIMVQIGRPAHKVGSFNRFIQHLSKLPLHAFAPRIVPGETEHIIGKLSKKNKEYHDLVKKIAEEPLMHNNIRVLIDKSILSNQKAVKAFATETIRTKLTLKRGQSLKMRNIKYTNNPVLWGKMDTEVDDTLKMMQNDKMIEAKQREVIQNIEAKQKHLFLPANNKESRATGDGGPIRRKKNSSSSPLAESFHTIPLDEGDIPMDGDDSPYFGKISKINLDKHNASDDEHYLGITPELEQIIKRKTRYYEKQGVEYNWREDEEITSKFSTAAYSDDEMMNSQPSKTNKRNKSSKNDDRFDNDDESFDYDGVEDFDDVDDGLAVNYNDYIDADGNVDSEGLRKALENMISTHIKQEELKKNPKKRFLDENGADTNEILDESSLNAIIDHVKDIQITKKDENRRQEYEQKINQIMLIKDTQSMVRDEVKRQALLHGDYDTLRRIQIEEEGEGEEPSNDDLGDYSDEEAVFSESENDNNDQQSPSIKFLHKNGDYDDLQLLTKLHNISTQNKATRATEQLLDDNDDELDNIEYDNDIMNRLQKIKTKIDQHEETNHFYFSKLSQYESQSTIVKQSSIFDSNVDLSLPSSPAASLLKQINSKYPAYSQLKLRTKERITDKKTLTEELNDDLSPLDATAPEINQESADPLAFLDSDNDLEYPEDYTEGEGVEFHNNRHSQKRTEHKIKQQLKRYTQKDDTNADVTVATDINPIEQLEHALLKMMYNAQVNKHGHAASIGGTLVPELATDNAKPLLTPSLLAVAWTHIGRHGTEQSKRILSNAKQSTPDIYTFIPPEYRGLSPKKLKRRARYDKYLREQLERAETRVQSMKQRFEKKDAKVKRDIKSALLMRHDRVPKLLIPFRPHSDIPYSAITVSLKRNTMRVSVSAVGHRSQALYKRGYRTHLIETSLRESIANGVLSVAYNHMSPIDKDSPLVKLEENEQYLAPIRGALLSLVNDIKIGYDINHANADIKDVKYLMNQQEFFMKNAISILGEERTQQQLVHGLIERRKDILSNSSTMNNTQSFKNEVNNNTNKTPIKNKRYLQKYIKTIDGIGLIGTGMLDDIIDKMDANSFNLFVQTLPSVDNKMKKRVESALKLFSETNQKDEEEFKLKKQQKLLEDDNYGETEVEDNNHNENTTSLSTMVKSELTESNIELSKEKLFQKMKNTMSTKEYKKWKQTLPWDQINTGLSDQEESDNSDDDDDILSGINPKAPGAKSHVFDPDSKDITIITSEMAYNDAMLKKNRRKYKQSLTPLQIQKQEILSKLSISPADIIQAISDLPSYQQAQAATAIALGLPHDPLKPLPSPALTKINSQVAVHARDHTPLSEVLSHTLSTGIIDADPALRIYDPFCGSGTLVIEGIMRFLGLPTAPLNRPFAFENWPIHDEYTYNAMMHHWKGKYDDIVKTFIQQFGITKYQTLYGEFESIDKDILFNEGLLNENNQNIEFPLFVGTDLRWKSVSAAIHNANNAGVNYFSHFFQSDFEKVIYAANKQWKDYESSMGKSGSNNQYLRLGEAQKEDDFFAQFNDQNNEASENDDFITAENQQGGENTMLLSLNEICDLDNLSYNKRLTGKQFNADGKRHIIKQETLTAKNKLPLTKPFLKGYTMFSNVPWGVSDDKPALGSDNYSNTKSYYTNTTKNEPVEDLYIRLGRTLYDNRDLFRDVFILSAHQKFEKLTKIGSERQIRKKQREHVVSSHSSSKKDEMVLYKPDQFQSNDWDNVIEWDKIDTFYNNGVKTHLLKLRQPKHANATTPKNQATSHNYHHYNSAIQTYTGNRANFNNHRGGYKM